MDVVDVVPDVDLHFVDINHAVSENPHQTPPAQPAPSRYPELDWFDEPGRGWGVGGLQVLRGSSPVRWQWRSQVLVAGW